MARVLYSLVPADRILRSVRLGMRGTITTWDILRHPLLIIRGFGPSCYLRCVGAALSRRPTTFLDVALRR
jgi:hypothetical protein